ncbi:MAG: hypothetical protein JJE22_02950, partial [Bacteroidia bacterium]|nr:hypothetical protein [Bacteroidia bacterium]
AGIAASILLIISCFIPWVIIESRNITVSGVDASGTNFGRPGYFHLIMSFLFLLLSFIQKVWAKRSNLLVTALNLGWAIRNYILISTCEMGDCPLKKAGIYILIPASVLMLVASMFPDMKLPEEKK